MISEMICAEHALSAHTPDDKWSVDVVCFHSFSFASSASAPISAAIPEMCGAAKLVPVPYTVFSSVSDSFTPGVMAMMASVASPPGAATVIRSPQLLYSAFAPRLVVDATEMTPSQLAGKYPDTFWLLLPAAATTTAPASLAWFTADCR